MLRGQLVTAFRAAVRDSVPSMSCTVEVVSTLSEEVSCTVEDCIGFSFH